MILDRAIRVGVASDVGVADVRGVRTAVGAKKCIATGEPLGTEVASIVGVAGDTSDGRRVGKTVAA